MKRRMRISADELIVDNFAGGGGASRGIPAWGFVFKRSIAWVKTHAKRRIAAALDAIEIGRFDRATQLVHGALKLQIGGGHYLRGAHELCLFATRDQTGLVRDVPTVIFAPRTQHSAKPDELLEIAERLSPGPRLEMFARRSRPGWVAWGNQAPTGDEL